MTSLTICFVTARHEPEIHWFLDSLCPQVRRAEKVHVIIVDYFAESRKLGELSGKCDLTISHVLPKPNVWQGKHRLTKGEWWATSAYRNTGICLCDTEWIAFLDDRCVLMPGYMQAIRQAMFENYAVCGAYQKRKGMTVENGVIKHGGIIIGEDPRKGTLKTPVHAPGSWFFGCNTALPLEWALGVNGYDETCDSLGLEDCIFGNMLAANRAKIVYDPSMMIVEDRTGELCQSAVQRTDKGVSPKDKSHALVERTAIEKRATHHWDLRQVRDAVLSGQPFPIPTEPTTDWWDGKPLSEFP